MGLVYTFIKEINIESIYVLDNFVLSLASFFSQIFSNSFSSSIDFFALIFVFICSCTLCKLSGQNQKSKIFLMSFIFCLSLFFISNNLLVFFDIYPLLLLCLINEFNSNSNSHLPIVRAISFLFEVYAYICSGVFSVVYFLIMVLVYPPKSKASGAVYFISRFIFSYFIFSWAVDKSIVFDYPPNSRLVDVSTFQRLGEVVFGKERLPLTVIPDRYLEIRNVSSLMILVSCFSLLGVLKIRYPRILTGILKSKNILVISIFLILIATSFLFTQENYYKSPEGFLLNFLPGLIWRPYPWLFSVWLLILIFLLLIKVQSNKIIKIYLVQFLVLVSFYLVFFQKNVFSVYTKSLTTEDLKNEIDLTKTPSSYLIENYKISSKFLASIADEDLSTSKLVPDLSKLCEVRTNRSIEKSNLSIDGRLDTKWSTKGNQKVGDWIVLECKSEIEFSKISLSLGEFSSDFPRGFIVYFGNSGGVLNPVKKYPIWFGNIEKTDKGFLYFGGQEKVVIDFDEIQNAKIIKISLTKGDPVFDWSVAEFQLYR